MLQIRTLRSVPARAAAFVRRRRREISCFTKLAFVLLASLCAAVNGAFAVLAISRAVLDAPPPTRLYTDRTGEYISDLAGAGGTYGYWQPPEELPSRLVSCLVAAEDRRFRQHPGVDPRSVLRAVASNIAGHPVQGASSLAMQVARLQNPAPRTFGNKLIESYTALLLTLRYGRDAVLRQYYVLAPQGNGIFGFGYSARRYFQKPVSDLSWAESALLVGIVKAPGTHNLFRPIGFLRAQKRARIVLRLARDQGYLDSETCRISLEHLNGLAALERKARPDHSYHFILRLAGSPGLSGSDAAPITDATRTTLDLKLQDYLQAVADYAMKNYRRFGAANVSIMVVSRHTGEVLGYIGSQDYFDEVHKGSINYANVIRSSGSTLKPFLYALGLESGSFTPASVLADLPFHVVNPFGEYTAGNFDGDYLGPMLYRYALGNSRNVPVIRVLEAMGGERTFAFLKTLGLVRGDKPAEHYGYSLALGGLYVTLEDLVRAYGILAGDGKKFELRWTRTAGSEAPAPGDRQETWLISEASARQISMFLSDPLARLPSFRLLTSMDFPFPVAFKTGTSQGIRDAWTIAYSSDYIVGIWLGHPDNEPMNHVAGSTVAGLIQNVFMHLEPGRIQGIDEVPFPPPRDTVPVRLCRFSGELATVRCAEVSVEYFRDGWEPHAYCSIHRLFAVDKKTGAPAREGTPPSRLEYVTRAVFPPQYAAWAAKQGYQPPPSVPVLPAELAVRVVSPRSGSRIVIDPELPMKFQSLPLRAEVTPAIPDIVWYVDGREYLTAPYPYEARWELEEGSHTFQARFSRAQVFSEKIHVTVSRY